MLNYAFVIAAIASALGFVGIGGMSAHFGWGFAALALVILAVQRLSGSRHTYFLPGSARAQGMDLGDHNKKHRRRFLRTPSRKGVLAAVLIAPRLLALVC